MLTTALNSLSSVYDLTFSPANTNGQLVWNIDAQSVRGQTTEMDNSNRLVFEKGDQLHVTNNGNGHHPLELSLHLPDAEHDITISTNAVYTVTLTTAGIYTYRCLNHPSMTGKFVVYDTLNFDPDKFYYNLPNNGKIWYPGRTGNAPLLTALDVTDPDRTQDRNTYGSIGGSEYCYSYFNNNKFGNVSLNYYGETGHVPDGQEHMSSVSVGDPWSDVIRPRSSSHCYGFNDMTVRQESKTLDGPIQQCHDHLNHVTSASLQSMVHDIGAGFPLSFQFQVEPLSSRIPIGAGKDIISIGNFFMRVPTGDDPRTEIMNNINQLGRDEYLKIVFSNHDQDLLNFGFNIGGRNNKFLSTDQAKQVKYIDEIKTSTVSLESLYYCKEHTGSIYNFEDGDYTLCSLSREHPLKHSNAVTGQLDASLVYGSTRKVAEWLRAPSSCKMKTSGASDYRLPRLMDFSENNEAYAYFKSYVSIGSLATFNNLGQREPDERISICGDRRCNENTYLLAMHTILVLQHNTICDDLANDAYFGNAATALGSHPFKHDIQ